MRRGVACVALEVLLLTLLPRVAAASDLLLVLDASGSMWGQIDGENKIVIARRVLGKLVDGLDEDAVVGLIAYGHRREGDCADIETVVPLGPLDKALVRSTVEGLSPKGKTPITAALTEAFGQIGEAGATVVLVSDGLETCGGDPCAATRLAKEKGAEFLLHVIGFDVAQEDVSQLECVAQAGGGLFLSAEDAAGLGVALERAVAVTPEVPPGRLSVQVVADGELHDAAVLVRDAATGEEMGGGRTYTTSETNPRVLPLPAGRYDVVVRAVGIEGDIERRLEGVEVAEGAPAEKTVDFSTGELRIGVTRNGALTDATYRVRVAGGSQEVASGRTYAAQQSNPASVRLTSGRYDVEVKSVEISAAGGAVHRIEGVAIEPRGQVRVDHEFESGTLRVGVTRGGERVDAVVNVVDLASNRSAAGGRTYTSETTNPKSFVLLPGSYRIEIQEIRGEKRQSEITVTAGETVERVVDLAED